NRAFSLNSHRFNCAIGSLVDRGIFTIPPCSFAGGRKGIKSLDFSAKSTPKWITLRKVPPDVISVEGISWISSMLGKPIKRFVRDGLDVKVCILRDKTVPCPEGIGLELEEGEICPMEVEQVKAREYSGKMHSVWMPKGSGVHKEACLSSGKGDKAVMVENRPTSEESPVNPDLQVTPAGGVLELLLVRQVREEGIGRRISQLKKLLLWRTSNLTVYLHLQVEG
ncbi:hypothetical protein LINPERPRIM_LOCUS11023, partial [Linum perenne]